MNNTARIAGSVSPPVERSSHANIRLDTWSCKARKALEAVGQQEQFPDHVDPGVCWWLHDTTRKQGLLTDPSPLHIHFFRASGSAAGLGLSFLTWRYNSLPAKLERSRASCHHMLPQYSYHGRRGRTVNFLPIEMEGEHGQCQGY